MIRKLTEKYVKAFGSKSLNEVLEMVAEDVFLSDPDNVVKNKAELKALLQKIFSGFNRISFEAKNIFVDGDCSVIEFELKLDNITLVGTDVIKWNDNKIQSLRAYLYKVS